MSTSMDAQSADCSAFKRYQKLKHRTAAALPPTDECNCNQNENGNGSGNGNGSDATSGAGSAGAKQSVAWNGSTSPRARARFKWLTAARIIRQRDDPALANSKKTKTLLFSRIRALNTSSSTTGAVCRWRTDEVDEGEELDVCSPLYENESHSVHLRRPKRIAESGMSTSISMVEPYNMSKSNLHMNGHTALRPRFEALQITVNRAPGFGLGIAIAGGTDNPNHSTGDPTIIITDVIKGGPAESKLRANDRILSVNGVPLNGVEHAFAARLLKESGSHATLVIRRPISASANGLSMQAARSRLSYPPPTVNRVTTSSNIAEPIGSPSSPVKESQLNPISSSSAPPNGVGNARHSAATDDGDADDAPGSVEKVVLRRRGNLLPDSIEIGCQFFVKRVDESLLDRLNAGDTLLKVGRVTLDSPFMSADDVRRLLIDHASTSDSITLLVDRAPDSNGHHRAPPPRPPLPNEYAQPVGRFGLLDYQPAALRFATASGVRRGVFDKSPTGSFGLRLVGGNSSGIFIGTTQAGSSASTRLVEGDRLLAIGQLDLVGPPRSTKEDALRALVNAPSRIELVWTSDAREEYALLIRSGEFGDDLFVRVHFSASYRRPAAPPVELRYNEVYHVVNTALGGQLGTWFGGKVDAEMRELTRSELPNEELAFQLAEHSRLELSLSRNDFASPSGESAQQSTNAIIRRLKRMATTDIGSTEANDEAIRVRDTILLSTRYAAYERVEARPASFVRPVAIYGPFAHVARDYLVRCYPSKYELVRSDTAELEAVVREIVSRSKHCILDVPLLTIDALNRTELHPIVVFIKPASRQLLKDVRSRLDSSSTHDATWLFELAVALERECSFMFSTTLRLTNDESWLKQLDETIGNQQSSPVWHVINSSMSNHREQSSHSRGSDASGCLSPTRDLMTKSAYAYLHAYAHHDSGQSQMHSGQSHGDKSVDVIYSQTGTFVRNGVSMSNSRHSFTASSRNNNNNSSNNPNQVFNSNHPVSIKPILRT